jgi:hypothetical protein
MARRQGGSIPQEGPKQMALKDFDYKQFLIEKGEKVGLGIALGLLALFLVVSAMGAFSAGSPTEKAKVLKDKTQSVQQQMATNTPTEADKPSAEESNQTFAFEYTPLDEDPFLLAGSLFHPDSGGNPNRAKPKIYNIEEAVVAIDRAQIKSYIFVNRSDKVLVYYLKGAKAEGAGLGNFLGNYGGSGAYGPAMGGGMGDEGGLPEGMGPEGGYSGSSPGAMLGLPGGLGQSQEKTKEYEAIPVDITELRKLRSVKLADQVRPLRMAIIGASFPYKKQLDEFRDKLRLGSYGEVLAERSRETGPNRRPLPNFRFLGVEVQRQILGPDGKVLRDWSALDLRNTYRPFVFYSGKRFEEDDPKLAPVRIPGLVMPLLERFRHDKDAKAEDAKDRYPQVADKLPKIQETLDALKGTEPTQVARPDPRFTTDNFDPFNPAPSPPPNGTGRFPGGSAGGMPPMPGTGMPGGEPESGYMEGSGASGLPPPPAGFPSGNYPPGRFPGTAAGQGLTVPEYCLVRLVDLTVQPGFSYKYRVRVRMGNPNYDRKDVLSPTYSRDKELISSDWFTIDQVVEIPPELKYYAVDQHFLDRSRTRIAPLRNNQTVLQMHRWLDRVKKEGDKPLLVGEWVVAERVPVYRGEYIGQEVPIKFPVWRTTRDDFVIENDIEKKRGRRTRPEKLVEVDFGARRLDGLDPVLVDFEEGSAITEYGTARVREDYATEVLLLTPDGKLVAHNSAADARDEERIERLNYFRDRLKKVKEKKKSTTGTPGSSPMGGIPFDCGP